MSSGNNGFFGFSTADAILTIEELDGAPSLKNLRKIIVSNGTLTDNGDNTATLDTGGGGSGDVTGPGSSTDRAIATWDGTAGDTLFDNPNATIDSNGLLTTAGYKLTAATPLTESGDAITITQSLHTVTSESGTADDLATINGATGRMFLVLQATATHTITVKHGTGNIFLTDGADTVLSGDRTLYLFYDGTNWASVDPATPWATPGAIGGTTPAEGTFTTLIANLLRFGAPAALTISSGAVTRTRTYHTLEAQTGTTDDLDAVNGGTQGDVVLLRADTGDTITVKHGTGNIQINSEHDVVLTGDTHLLLVYRGPNWVSVEPRTPLTTKGDLLTRSSSAVVRLAVGSTQGHALVVESNEAAGIKYRNPHAFPIVNKTGNTVAVGDVGIIADDATYGDSFQQTTTANVRAGIIAVVVDIGASGADATVIWVARKGKVLITLDGNCSVGDYIVTSTTARRGHPQSTMRPEVFAKAHTANGSGAGGQCEALLYCYTSDPVGLTDTNYLWSVLNTATFAFTATISAVTATTITYTPVSGSEVCIVPGAATDLLKMRIYNTTSPRNGQYRVMTAVNTGTNVITNVSSGDSWQVGDGITLEGVVVSGLSYKFASLDFSQTSIFPAMVRQIQVVYAIVDSGAAGSGFAIIHPNETYGGAKVMLNQTQVSGLGIKETSPWFALIDQSFAVSCIASGAATASYTMQIFAYTEAIP